MIYIYGSNVGIWEFARGKRGMGSRDGGFLEGAAREHKVVWLHFLLGYR